MAKPKGKILINTKDIIGKRLGKLEVICYVGHKHVSTMGGDRMRHYYACTCRCGKTTIIERGPLLSGIVHSCGCSKRKKNKIRR